METKEPTFNFIEKAWQTNRSYNDNFSEIPNASGVYLLVLSTFEIIGKEIKYEILYVGSSKDLKQRYRSHEVLRLLTQVYGNNVRFYFKKVKDYYEEEKKLIKLTKARFNTQWR